MSADRREGNTLAVSVICYLKGDPRQLLAGNDDGWPLTPSVTESGLIYHACLELPDGIKMISHFATEEQARTFLAGPGVAEVLGGLTVADDGPVLVPVHAYRFGGVGPHGDPGTPSSHADAPMHIAPVLRA
jgi:hypothetical protein